MKWVGAACLLWVAAALLQATEVYSYWIQPCTEVLAAHSGCDAADPELARWALEAWQRSGGSGLRFAAASEEDDALVRFYWLGRSPQLYGDNHTVFLNGKRVRVVEVQPDLAQFGPRMAAAGQSDELFRDTVVYLTCLHEIGHVLALPHTDDFTDIMYSFQYGGDVVEYFNRYRRAIRARPDIREHSGISEADRKRVAELYAGR
ncbi:MAG TPA: hypothetical protein VN924_02815 [Bryobacteraceae bacterium]|nr:hypothetical protein [Bryobacteraceae bacterium]